MFFDFEIHDFGISEILVPLVTGFKNYLVNIDYLLKANNFPWKDYKLKLRMKRGHMSKRQQNHQGADDSWKTINQLIVFLEDIRDL